jgi:WD40 repeat protein
MLLLILGINTKLKACGTKYLLPSHAYNPNSVIVSSDGTLLATTGTMPTGDGTVNLFFVDSGILSDGASYPLKSGHTPTAITFSSNGQLVATANASSNSITVFMVIINNELVEAQEYSLPSGCKSPQALAFSPDGSLLAVANSSSSNVVVFKSSQEGLLSQPTLYSLPPGDKSPEALVFSPDGLLLATANSNSNNITTFRVSTGTLTEATSYSLPSGSHSPQSLAFSPDGSLLATGNFDSDSVTIFQAVDGQLTNATSYALPHYCAAPISVAFSSDGNYLAISCSYPNKIALFTVINGMLYDGVSYVLPESTFSTSVAFLPNSTYIASGTTAVEYGESVNSNVVVMLNTALPCIQSNSCDGECIASLTAMGIVGFCAVAGCGLWLAGKCLSRDSSERQRLIET